MRVFAVFDMVLYLMWCYFRYRDGSLPEVA